METRVQAPGTWPYAARKESLPLLVAWEASRRSHYGVAQAYVLVVNAENVDARTNSFLPRGLRLDIETRPSEAANPDAARHKLSSLHAPRACECETHGIRHSLQYNSAYDWRA